MSWGPVKKLKKCKDNNSLRRSLKWPCRSELMILQGKDLSDVTQF